MTTTTSSPIKTSIGGSSAREMLNKVPEVTIFFWFIKIMATTVGETAADYLNDTLGFGLTNTTIAMGALLIVALAFQFRLRRYVPTAYWLCVVFISVVGTLITDNLTDRFGVPLLTSTIVFAAALAAVFAGWYAVEKTLSIHSIFSRRRESFYWLTILFTFALGTATGDYIAETQNLGYSVSILIFAGVIAAITAVHYALQYALNVDHQRHRTNAVLAFWLAYIITRPLGASIGDYMSQAKADGGIGLGTTVTSAIFLGAILALVAFLTITKRDVIELQTEEEYLHHGHAESTPHPIGSEPALEEGV